MSYDGQLITFYSYKGGTGRTMALANVACLLARAGRRVLAIDWDLEAPGLHRFLPTRTGELSSPGLIELMEQLTADPTRNAKSAVDDVFLENFVLSTQVPSLFIIKAGRLDQAYEQRVRGFNWQGCFDRTPTLFSDLAEKLTSMFEYVLIDSRTGISDAGGVCTMLMPEKLVLVFTPNEQSLFGGIEIVRRATQYRLRSGDVRRYVVYPLPSRVELAEVQLRQDWRVRYQKEFEDLFCKTYDLQSCYLTTYFDEVQIPHYPRYAYGEEIAVMREDQQTRLTLANCFSTFLPWLTDRTPWEEHT